MAHTVRDRCVLSTRERELCVDETRLESIGLAMSALLRVNSFKSAARDLYLEHKTLNPTP